MIYIEALPADEGDCLWIEWPDAQGMTHRMLVDGGYSDSGRIPPGLAGRLARQPEDQRAFDLMICTHIDADHIGGLLALANDPPPGFRASDVWFNGRRHLDLLNAAQGDALSTALTRNSLPWNQAFGEAAIVVPVGGDLPVVQLPGLRITLLSPARAQLARLAQAWSRVVAEANRTAERPAPDLLGREDADRVVALHRLMSRPYRPDMSAANGSSIAFLAEDDDGDRVLLAADATAEMLAASLRRLAMGGRYRVDLCKVPHHGSRHNTSPELLFLLDCRHWLLSTSGRRHGHPNREAMARILCRPEEATAWFNYRSPAAEEYAGPDLGLRYGFSAMYPETADAGIALRIVHGRVERANCDSKG